MLHNLNSIDKLQLGKQQEIHRQVRLYLMKQIKRSVCYKTKKADKIHILQQN